jgi:translation initiation factor IF-3
MDRSKKQHLINNEIRCREIRLVDCGIISLNEGLRLAEEQNLDLVLMSPNSNPPVCKIMDYQKFIYEQSKKNKQKTPEIKEIKIGPNTSDNDLDYRVKHSIDFLKKGHRVKITMQFKGREMIYVTKGQELILNLILKLDDFGVAESMPKLEGKKLSVNIRPKKI